MRRNSIEKVDDWCRQIRVHSIICVRLLKESQKSSKVSGRRGLFVLVLQS